MIRDWPDLQAYLQIDTPTLEKLQQYGGLLRHWNRRLNLVAPASLQELCSRHMADSAQVFKLLPPETQTLVDLGSGAGFPGLVLKILGVPSVTLVESDRRKCIFLREVARQLDIEITVLNQRIESYDGPLFEVVTARALAPLEQLLAYAAPFCGRQSRCFFLKGAEVAEELTNAQKQWHIKWQDHSSVTSTTGHIIEITEMQRDSHF